MGKRKSITGVKKRPQKTARLGDSATRSVAVGSSPSASPVSAKVSKPRQLLSTRIPPPDKPLSWKQEADRVGPGSKGVGSLKSRVKHVSQDIIRSKWTVLHEDAQAKVEELLHSIELPILAIYSSDQRKIEAQVALRSITGTLCKRLPRMPFPPQAKGIHFDYETLVKDNRNLQQSLALTVTSRVSLVGQIEKQKLALSSELQELENLETADRRVVG